MIYLLDTSGLVRLLRDPGFQDAWYDAIDAEGIGSCYPQRTEFLYSARNAAEGSCPCSARCRGRVSIVVPQR